jgi:hypothetical protein
LRSVCNQIPTNGLLTVLAALPPPDNELGKIEPNDSQAANPNPITAISTIIARNKLVFFILLSPLRYVNFHTKA